MNYIEKGLKNFGKITFCLFIGSFCYLLFRPEVQFIQFFDFSPHKPLILIENKFLQIFFCNYFCDIMWCVFICEAALLLKKFKVYNIYIIILLALPMASEIGQYFGIIKGTFDIVDLIIYILIQTSYLIINRKKIFYEQI